MLEVNNLQAGYADMQVLWDVSMRVEAGSITSLLGANGVGKSTLLRSVMGMTKIGGGNVFFEENDITQLPSHCKVELGLALVPEGKHLFADMTVLENLEMGTYPHRAGRTRRRLTSKYLRCFRA